MKFQGLGGIEEGGGHSQQCAKGHKGVSSVHCGGKLLNWQLKLLVKALMSFGLFFLWQKCAHVELKEGK